MSYFLENPEKESTGIVGNGAGAAGAYILRHNINSLAEEFSNSSPFATN
jgi:hypothetical protein